MRYAQTPASRRSDPDNSHLAEKRINENGSRVRQQALAAELVKRYPGQTSGELSRYGLLTERQLSRRLGEAETAKAIRRGDSKICEHSGHRAATWWPVDGQGVLL